MAEYLIDLSATNAAVRAGYSVRSADTLGPRLVRKSRVSVAIQSALAERIERTNISHDSVVTELAAIAFSDMRTYADWGAHGVHLTNSALLAPDARCVAEVSQTHAAGGGSLKIRLHDKVRALELLGRHVGLFPVRGHDQSDVSRTAFVVLGGQRIYF